MIDLDAYFARIGYDGPRTLTLATLGAVQLAHAQTIPFENLDPYLHRPVSVDLAAIQKKLVQGRRGGWCYEHNTLFSAALRQLGFNVRWLMARVMWGAPPDAPTARSHMVVLIESADGSLIADVGFGGVTLTAPLRLEPDFEQRTPHEVFRFVQHRNTYTMQVKLKDGWNPVYRFDLSEHYLSDFEARSWYLSNFPGSHFLQNIMVAMPLPGRRIALLDNHFTIHHLDGRTERQVLADADAVREVMAREFGLPVDAIPELDAALGRIVATKA